MKEELRAPFPYFGGKSRVSHLIWEAFGEPAHYVEAFCGSAAVLLGRPDEPQTETINDADGWISNVWRAINLCPDGVARHVDRAIIEVDLVAWHNYLNEEGPFLAERLKSDPFYYNTKLAAIWIWGQSIWIGAGWLGQRKVGIKKPSLHLNGNGIMTVSRRERITLIMHALAARLRRVRILCGEWNRPLTPGALGLGDLKPFAKVAAVFLDPPYSDLANRSDKLYSTDSLDVAHKVREWAIANGDDPRLRICLAGYAGEHDMPKGWSCLSWVAQGGYANQGKNRAIGKENRQRERLWFSPHCVLVSEKSILSVN